jgi:hypothetical protein
VRPSEIIAYTVRIVTGELPDVIRRYVTGRDLVQIATTRFVIDLYGFDEAHARLGYPKVYQHILDRVLPERAHNPRKAYRDRWWVFAEPRPMLRDASKGLKRYIATPNTAKHRVFQFVPGAFLPDTTVYAIPVDDAWILGCVSSRIHAIWSLRAGGTLEDRPRYTSKGTFFPFPFPSASEQQKSRIQKLGEQLDAHRKCQQAQHRSITITSMYNVLEKLRTQQRLTKNEQTIHDQGLIAILRQIHDELDAAVAEAYGWPADVTEEEVLARLVALNHERAEEERRGIIHWLRPEFQNPTGKKQTAIAVADEPVVEKKPAKAAKQSWPKSLSEQAGAVLNSLAAFTTGASAKDIAKSFGRATDGRVERIEEILETLEALGKARELDDGRYVSV